MTENELINIDDIKSRIFTIRGMQVMLDSDLAEFFGVETKRLNEQ
ncbi:MAG TPA: ORF6N domain-containing protein, partial [bacterium]|nr:ORF6N domain-containing protein [bacterium]